MELSELSALIATELPEISIREEIRVNTQSFIEKGGKIRRMRASSANFHAYMEGKALDDNADRFLLSH